MKKVFFTLSTCLLLSIAGNSQLKKFKDIIGHWDISGEENAGVTLQIIDSANIVLIYMGEKKNIVDYKIDFTKSPVWFDFTTKDSSSRFQVKSIIELIGDDVIKWQLFIDEDRSAHFFY